MRYRQLVNGDTILFEPDDIYHWVEEQDPDNELFGLSIMEGILYDVM